MPHNPHFVKMKKKSQANYFFSLHFTSLSHLRSCTLENPIPHSVLFSTECFRCSRNLLLLCLMNGKQTYRTRVMYPSVDTQHFLSYVKRNFTFSAPVTWLRQLNQLNTSCDCDMNDMIEGECELWKPLGRFWSPDIRIGIFLMLD